MGSSYIGADRDSSAYDPARYKRSGFCCNRSSDPGGGEIRGAVAPASANPDGGDKGRGL